MKNRVYYGQYSLKHWIDLILKKNLLLPDYQRFFVWEQQDINTLINSIKNKEFVPPITIGAATRGSDKSNLILDGQQRLTSILLAFLGLFPDKAKFKLTVERLTNDNDDGVDDVDDEDVMKFDNILEWDFRALTTKGTTKQQILDGVISGNYSTVVYPVTGDFFEKNFLGFSFLVPDETDVDIQQKYFSTVFRNINIQGKTLLPQESRASLYFLKKDYDQFFNPAFIRLLAVKNSNADTKADFVRYLSLLSQYAKDGGSGAVARGYKSEMETYYEHYIYSVVGGDTANKFKDFTEIFPAGNFQDRLEKLNVAINSIEIPKEYPSIIDMDVYLFGMIYCILFEDKVIDVIKKDELKAKLAAKVAEFKGDEKHKRSPGLLKYLKARIDASIAIYKENVS